MHQNLRSAFHPVWAAAVTLLVSGPAVAQKPVASSPSERVNAVLGLEQSIVFPLAAYLEVDQPILAMVPVEGLEEIVFLEPYSVRDASYRVLVQHADGELIEAPPSPVRTLRGSIVGVEGSLVAGSLLDDGLHARILYPDGQEYWIEPVGDRVAGIGAGQYVVYASEHVLPAGGTCEADALSMPHEVHDALPTGDVTLFGGAACVAQLACDADYEYFQTWGSVAGTENRINAVINAVNVQYQSEVGITHAISTIIVRSTSNDPYSRKRANQLLDELQNEWENNQTGVVRDVVHLFTGKELSGSTIGIAYIGAVCTNFGYGLVQSDFAGTGNFACTTDLSAHELGHNWGANHCNCSSYTMNAGITCANQFNPSITIPAIVAFRDSVNCLDSCGGGTTPTGACCLSDDSCTVVSAADCSSMGGTYLGDGTDCSPDPCGPGGSGEAPITSATVQKGTIVSGFLEDLYFSDDSSVLYSARKQGPRYLSDLQVVHASPFASVSQLDLTTEIGMDVTGVDVTISLRNHSSNQWDVIDTYPQPTADTMRVNANVANPNNYVDASGEVIVRVETLKSGNGGAHTVRVDQVQVVVTQ